MRPRGGAIPLSATEQPELLAVSKVLRLRAYDGRAEVVLGWREVRVEEIYDWNEGSRRCFASQGFVACSRTARGDAFVCRL